MSNIKSKNSSKIRAKKEPKNNIDNADNTQTKEVNTPQKELKKMTENIVELYDNSISSVSCLINTIYETLDNSKHEDDEIREQLRESLAKKLTLRKKDFDTLYSELIADLSQKNKFELKLKINEFLKEHCNSVALLKKQIAADKKIRIEEFKNLFSRIQSRQQERENEVKNMINDFRKQHKKMINNLKDFLSEDRNMRIKDLKNLMNEFKLEKQKRIEENKKRARRWREKTSLEMQ